MPRRKRKRAIPVVSVVPDRMRVLKDEYLAWPGSKNYSEDTVNKGRVCIGYFPEWCGERSIEDVTEVTRPVLERYQRSVSVPEEGRGAADASHAEQPGAGFEGVVSMAGAAELLLHNPASELILPRLENRLPKYVLSVEEMEAVLRQPDVAKVEGLRDRAILEVFYSTGMRRMELANLKVYDLDRERGAVMIRMGKGKKDRYIPMSERAFRWIDKYVEEARPSLLMASDDGTVFLVF